jgi:hypothetical protein
MKGRSAALCRRRNKLQKKVPLVYHNGNIRKKNLVKRKKIKVIKT